MAINEQIHSDLAVPPGEYLVEVLEEFGMTKDELAKRMNRPAPKLSAIFKGDKMITPDTALQLEKVVGVPAHIWTGLESEYRLTLARRQQAEEQERLQEESKLVTKYRYNDLVKMGAVSKFTRPVDKVLALQKYFGVTCLKTVPSLRRYQPAFRSGKQIRKSGKPEAIASWLRMGELSAAHTLCSPFNRMMLEQSLDQIRQMTRQSPDKFQEALHQLLVDSGVALVLCPHMPGTGIHGATFWMGPDKAVVMMTIRYKWADIFWFSLFHELGHILLHGRNMVILEGLEGDQKHKKQEDQADIFTADTLIPLKAYKSFVAGAGFFPDDIRRFSDQINIHPGIVVGRLQNDGFLKKEWHNGLRVKFEWKSA